MRVGIIGLGRMGEGMSRRLLNAGIETWGYRRNLAKANEAYEKGYVTGIANDFETLVRMVHDNNVMDNLPGIFMLVVPAETVVSTLDELLAAGSSSMYRIICLAWCVSLDVTTIRRCVYSRSSSCERSLSCRFNDSTRSCSSSDWGLMSIGKYGYGDE